MGKWLLSLPVGGFWMIQTLEYQYPSAPIVNNSVFIIRGGNGEF